MRKNKVTGTLITLVWLVSNCVALAAEAATGCFSVGTWARPGPNGTLISTAYDALDAADRSQFVLLGEAHDNAEHHLWQLQSLGMLLGSSHSLVIGMEMFPRRLQPVLDGWIAGELSESEFLQQSEWHRIWRFDPALYLPILRFARLNRVPLVALNVERQLIADIGADGLSTIDVARREGVGDRETASEAYRSALWSSFKQHAYPDETAFDNFVQAQTFWDRAFAEALSEARVRYPAARVVGIIGSGHLQYKHGVPHQLRSLGHQHVTVWLPVDSSKSCDELANIADAVFVVDRSEQTPPPRLGVYLRDDESGTTVHDVVPGSVAELAGLESGDRIVTAAGIRVVASDDLVTIVRRQAVGTWLPLTIARNGETLDIIAKFPSPAAETDTGKTK